MSGKHSKRQRDASRKDFETEKPPKRRRQDDNLKLSKLYEDLAAESDETRLEAAKQIIIKFSPENEPSAQAVETALNRLVKGLCSSRKAARVGFCITLTELLGQIFRPKENVNAYFSNDVNSIIDLVVEKTKVEGNVPGQVRLLPHSDQGTQADQNYRKGETISSASSLATKRSCNLAF
jgi:hypothetical protein